ncbi:MAG TPA: patatin-like phospholipase family protein [Pyrinomonadaceae bacterium]|nr:patatin-like phospholipase family protein [Pyrinomonadaceae bacterium]
MRDDLGFVLEKLRNPVSVALFGFFLYMFLVAYLQGRGREAWGVFGRVLSIYIVVFWSWTLFLRPGGVWAPLALLAALFWLLKAGSYHMGIDLLLLFGLFFTLLLVIARPRWVGRLFRYIGSWVFWNVRQWLNNRGEVVRPSENLLNFQPLAAGRSALIAVILLPVFWGVSSGLNSLLAREGVRREPGRFKGLRAQSPWGGARVGLALSGGGYRAVLMHAGVLGALEARGVPVTHLTTVSGGSIAGAFYAAGGSPEALRDAVAEGRFNLPRSVTDMQNALRLPFPGQLPGTGIKLLPLGSFSFSRTDVQANLLERTLLSDVKLGDIPRAEGGPRLMVCATDLFSGDLYGFGGEHILRRHVPQAGQKRRFETVAAAEASQRAASPAGELMELAAGERLRGVPLSRIVAASGAFPGVLNAVPEEMPAPAGAGGPGDKLLLADGGITDNSALTILEHAQTVGALSDTWGVDLAISSDASALLGPDEALTSLGEATRSVDIVYANVGGAPCGSQLKEVLLSPGSLLDIRGVRPGMYPGDQKKFIRSHVGARVAAFAGRATAAGSREWAESLEVVARALPEGELKERVRGIAEGAGPSKEEAEALAGALADDLAECLLTFLRTPTLQDQFEEDEARKLYRLGHYLLALEWPLVKDRLNAAHGHAPVTVAGNR